MILVKQKGPLGMFLEITPVPKAEQALSSVEVS